jgi:hypothetical protein
VFVTFDATAGTPSAISSGKVIRVPPPASAFTAPPATAASPTRPNSNPVIVFFFLSDIQSSFPAKILLSWPQMHRHQVKLLIVVCNTMAALAREVIEQLSPVPVLDETDAWGAKRDRGDQEQVALLAGSGKEPGAGKYCPLERPLSSILKSFCFPERCFIVLPIAFSQPCLNG